ncbi:MAG: thioredoxin family protein, partial [Odoribacter sp.]|nr:thioredoxin family protein [Odoribacter sp.]
MRKCFLIIGLLAVAISAGAQINFREGGFNKALEAAKAENKLVFMDCYTSWCGPCKMLASKVFPQKEAGDYFNPRFVSLKMDMEKGEGVALSKKYDVNAYPTLLILDANGELLCRYAGYLEVDKLIAFAENGTKGGGLTEMHKRYAAGERSMDFISDYLTLLDDAAMSGTLFAVADD